MTNVLFGQDTSLYKKLALLEYGIDFKNDKYGILKDSGQVKYKYDTLVYPRHTEYYFALQQGNWGVVDKQDQVIISFEYEMIAKTWYNNFTGVDTFIVQKNNYLGTVDFQGKTVIPFKYDGISGWCENGPRAHYVIKDKKFGLIKHDGTIIIPTIYDAIHYYGPSIIKVKSGEKFGIINAKNNEIIPVVYESIIVDFNYSDLPVSEDHQDKYVVLKNGTWSYIDENGELIQNNVSQEIIEKEYAEFQLTHYDLTYTNYCMIKKIKNNR